MQCVVETCLALPDRAGDRACSRHQRDGSRSRGCEDGFVALAGALHGIGSNDTLSGDRVPGCSSRSSHSRLTWLFEMPSMPIRPGSANRGRGSRCAVPAMSVTSRHARPRSARRPPSPSAAWRQMRSCRANQRTQVHHRVGHRGSFGQVRVSQPKPSRKSRWPTLPPATPRRGTRSPSCLTNVAGAAKPTIPAHGFSKQKAANPRG